MYSSSEQQVVLNMSLHDMGFLFPVCPPNNVAAWSDSRLDREGRLKWHEPRGPHTKYEQLRHAAKLPNDFALAILASDMLAAKASKFCEVSSKTSLAAEPAVAARLVCAVFQIRGSRGALRWHGGAHGQRSQCVREGYCS